MNRYIVWAVFGVDADSPEQAKEILTHFVDPNLVTTQRIGLADKYHVNSVVFMSPAFDKLIDNAIQEEG